MQIQLQQIGKQYHQEWIIRDVNHTFPNHSITGIQGANGSGKSTLLQIISSLTTPTEGEIEYTKEQKNIPKDQIPTVVAHVAPNIDLIGAMTVEDTMEFHFKFIPCIEGENIDKVLHFIDLFDHKDSLVQELSSGMRQRLKLGLAFFSSVDLLLLDEPTSNLDQKGIDLFSQFMHDYRKNRTTVIASNEERDFDFCKEILSIQQWKPTISDA